MAQVWGAGADNGSDGIVRKNNELGVQKHPRVPSRSTIALVLAVRFEELSTMFLAPA
jgi:hypothetical protein